jgi:hypothetical protein
VRRFEERGRATWLDAFYIAPQKITADHAVTARNGARQWMHNRKPKPFVWTADAG